MPTYLDFNSTKGFRDFMISKTLNAPNGPQTFTEQSYPIQGTSDYANVDPGDVTTNLEQELLQSQTHNIFKPLEYWVTEYLRVIPRRANLSLYPYFVPGSYSLVSIMATDNYDTESQLFKFAANNIKHNENGPVFARIQQNLYAATVGRFRLIDALNGNLSTALNIVMGREPLIELNTKITVAKTLPGKAIDFLQTVTGTEWPFSEIPGHYLSDPRNPIINRPEAETEGGRFFQDLTGALGSLVGIQRRPLSARKPSDLFIEYTGQAPKQSLFDLLSYSKYAPNYTKTARSQNTSKVFNFVDNAAQGVNKLFGLDAPAGVAYIGDDRGDNVKFAMGDFNDNQIRGPWYLDLMFDEVQARLFHNDKSIMEGGEIGGKLLWVSSNSQNKLGEHNAEYSNESSDIEESLSTKFSFRDGSILGKTQSILETLPDGGVSRTHVANAIDQTSRVFSEGDVRISRGSAIKYVDQYTGEESGVEYCRVWTKDRSYMNMSDLMKNGKLLRNQNIPEAGGSVLDSSYNLNIYPNSDGNKGFQGSSNIVEGESGFYAKKYMFSLENLAWKTSNLPGFTYEDLPYCERGNNGGRVMWFPPYDLKVTEQNNANWDETLFLGRPEPVYTYQNTARNGTVSFKVIVDHPSILNLLTRDHFKDMSDQEADNYINAFFAGCKNVDFYDLIRKYTTLSKDDIQRIQNYLNAGKDPDTVTLYKSVLEPVEESNLPGEQTSTGANDKGTGEIVTNVDLPTTKLFFQNDTPTPNAGKTTTSTYSSLYQRYSNYEESYTTELKEGLHTLFSGAASNNKENDMFLLYGKTNPNPSETDTLTGITVGTASDQFNKLTTHYTTYDDVLTEIKSKLDLKDITELDVKLVSSASSVAGNEYNLDLSFRRSHSVIIDILNKIKKDGTDVPTVSWNGNDISPIPLKNLGYVESLGKITFSKIDNNGETGSGCEDKDFKTSDNLKKTAPITFQCRYTSVTIESQLISPNDSKAGDKQLDDQKNPNIPKVNLIPVNSVPVSSRKPALDELKRIIMKTLSECNYFKQFEKDSPVAFTSLKEKLRYFHPAFHSMTPEGLNARLTFLNQCIRPGDTMPIKGLSDLNDLTARNTTFGPPPICVLRIGDFYHSKVAIKDVNIDYDESTWDLNPEGIGIQPMIANVTLQVSFIGGHGLEKPVELLQNALTSNFYANTEMYDHRATATEDRSKYTKEFLEDLLLKANKTPEPDPNTNSANNIKTGEYIGVKLTVNEESTLEYSKLVEKTYTELDSYFTAYQKSLYDISSKYGSKISSMFFSPEYRPIEDYTIQTGSGTDTMKLLGEYEIQPPNDFGYYVGNFRTVMGGKVQNTDISTLIKLDRDLGEGQLIKSEQILKQYVGDLINDLSDEFQTNKSITSVEKSRGELTQTLDKLNFIIEHNHDGYLVDYENTTGVTFSSYSTFYDKYEKVIEHIQDQHHKFTDDLDTTFIFAPTNVTMSDDVFSELLSILLYEHKEEILSLYEADSTFSNKITKIGKRLRNFVEEPDPIEVKLKKFPPQKDTNPVIFTIQDELFIFNNTQIEELIKIMSNKVALGTTLNFYKNEH